MLDKHHLQDSCLTGRIIPVRVAQANLMGMTSYLLAALRRLSLMAPN